MAGSVFELMGLDLDVPHYSTLSRRAADLEVDLARKSKGPLHLVLDSTGLKVYGEGEWKVRKHGYSKRRTWRKLHLAIDAESHEIQAVAVTEAGVDDAEEVDQLLEPIDREVASAAADGAYDKRKVYRALEPRAGRILIPPRSNARIWKHGNAAGPPLARDETRFRPEARPRADRRGLRRGARPALQIPCPSRGEQGGPRRDGRGPRVRVPRVVAGAPHG